MKYIIWAAKTTDGKVFLFEAEYGLSRDQAMKIAEEAWNRWDFVTVWHLLP